MDPAADAALQAGLDYLFSFYAAGYQRQLGKFDREVRCPEVFMRIASELALLPVPAKTVLVTGSKGKGSCARLIAHYLQQAGYRVGLVLTPEELSHLDRIRINGSAISAPDFLASLAALKPLLERPVAAAHYYHPPSAIFLLIALHHFRQGGLDYVVIEGGRGAQYDEIGQIPAAVGVVTSILPEHLSKLGPSLAQICADKFSLMRNCARLVCAQQAWVQAQAAHLPGLLARPATPPAQVRIAHALPGTPAMMTAPTPNPAQPPAWFDIANGLAQETLGALGLAKPSQSATMTLSPSCQRLDASVATRLPEGALVFLDGAITPECLDLAYLDSSQCQPNAIVLGLTADKNGEAMLAFLQLHGYHTIFHFQASSSLSDMAVPTQELPWMGKFDKQHGLDAASGAALLELVCRHQRVYVIGVQVFLRAVRQALGVRTLSGAE